MNAKGFWRKSILSAFIIISLIVTNCINPNNGGNKDENDIDQFYIVYFDGSITNLTDNSAERSSPSIYENYVVYPQYNSSTSWSSLVGKDLCIFDLSRNEIILKLSNVSINNKPQIYKNNIVWIGYDQDYNDIIFLYDIKKGEQKIIENYPSQKGGLDI